MKKLTLALAGTMLFSSLSTAALAETQTPGKFYIGFEAGRSVPVKDDFIDESTNTNVSLKKADLYTARLGYEFAPNTFFEFSGSKNKTFPMGIKLPNNLGAGNTKAVAQVFMGNIKYNFAPIYTVTPFFIIGAGVAKVDVKNTSIKHPMDPAVEIFNTPKQHGNYFSSQVGLGVEKNITPNLALDFAAKLQVVSGIKVKYNSLSATTGRYTPGTIKKTIGVYEFSAGATYRLPF